jgi:hypothetical protein
MKVWYRRKQSWYTLVLEKQKNHKSYQDSTSSGQDLNLEPPTYEAEWYFQLPN